MSKPLTQIGDEVREMTDEEYAEWQQHAKEVAERQAFLEAKAAAKAAVLAKLGLTADEAAALLG